MGDWNAEGSEGSLQPRPFDQESDAWEPPVQEPAARETPRPQPGGPQPSSISLPRYKPPTPPAQRSSSASLRPSQPLDRPTSAEQPPAEPAPVEEREPAAAPASQPFAAAPAEPVSTPAVTPPADDISLDFEEPAPHTSQDAVAPEPAAESGGVAPASSWEGRTASIWDVPKPPPDWEDEPDVPEPVVPAAGYDEPEIPSGGGYEPPERPGRSPWLYAVIGLVVGILIGAGLLVWQRTAMLADQRELEDRLRSVEESATLSAEQVSSMTTKLAQYEASMTAQASQITSMASQLASTQAALTLAESKIAEANKTLTIVERSVDPGSVVKGKPLALIVKVKGKADSVSMKVIGVSPVSFSKTYSLSKVGTSGGIETWKRTIDAPTTVGAYRYYATATIGSKSFEMPGVSAWTFEVKDTP